MLPSILIVDDNQDACELFQELLEMQGYTVRAAYTGQQALDLMARGTSSLFLLDLNLPDIHGTALAPQLRARAQAQGVDRPVVIAITGMAYSHSDPEMDVFDHLLVKPVDFAQFDRLLEQCVATLQGSTSS